MSSLKKGRRKVAIRPKKLMCGDSGSMGPKMSGAGACACASPALGLVQVVWALLVQATIAQAERARQRKAERGKSIKSNEMRKA